MRSHRQSDTWVERRGGPTPELELSHTPLSRSSGTCFVHFLKLKLQLSFLRANSLFFSHTVTNFTCRLRDSSLEGTGKTLKPRPSEDIFTHFSLDVARRTLRGS